MRGRKSALVVLLTTQERAQLDRWIRSTQTPAGLLRRATMVQAIAEGQTFVAAAHQAGLTEKHGRKWVNRFLTQRLDGLSDRPGRGRKPVSSPQVALHTVKIACERPDVCGRSLCLWDCGEIARVLVAQGITPSISAESVRRILRSHRLKPWRKRMWLSPQVPRDAAFAASVRRICELYTRPLADHERVLCADEHTRLQPRPRLAPTRPALPERPVQVEHEYRRDGALNLLAAFDTRRGKV